MITEKELPKKLHKTISVNLSDITKSDNGMMRAIITAELPDSDGDIVVVDGITWERYSEDNPLPVLSSHLRKLPDGKPPQVGFSPRLTKTKTAVDGQSVPAVLMEWQWLDTELAREWQEVATKTGRLSFSIGAIVHEGEPIENKDGIIEGFLFTSTELTEVSVVTIPANPSALSIKSATETTEVKEELIKHINNGFEEINKALTSIASSVDALEARVDEIATAQTVTPIEIDEANETTKAQSSEALSEHLTKILDKIKTIKSTGEPLNGDQRDTN